MNKVYILLGGNLGDKLHNITQAIRSIEDKAGTVVNSSHIYETAAWGHTSQPAFYNCVIELQTELQPVELLHTLLHIEKELGRVRDQKWHERIIDIDIIYYNNSIIDMPELQVPHVQLQHRRFALVPLAEIAPDFLHPVLKRTNQCLLQHCEDPLEVKLIA